MAPVPVALRNWLKGTYPTLNIDEQWLQDCVDYLQTKIDDTQAVPTLIKRVDEQFVMSDLRDSVSPPGPMAQLIDAEHGLDLSQTRGVLVQITSITDIGHSAVSLREAKQKRKEESAGGPVVVGNVEEDEQGPTHFPRSMLSMQLSDGYTTLKAIEYEKLPFLKLGETPLGSKLLLRQCRVRRGVALLTPATTIWKKGNVQEMQEFAEQSLDEGLEARIQAQRATKRVPKKARWTAAPTAPTSNSQARPTASATIELDEKDFLKDGEDLDAAMAAFEADRITPAGTGQQPRVPYPKVNVPPPQYDIDSDVDMFGDDDEIWPEETQVAAPTLRKQATVISIGSSP